MKNRYSSLLSYHDQILEDAKAPFQFFTERHLQALWLEQKYFKSLITSSGETVKVISPGIWNQNAGPDFLKAHLVIGNTQIFGDVEIHLSSNDWYYHGHHQDSRYDHVCLHVSLWNQKITRLIFTNSGKEIPHISIESHLTCQLSKLTELIDVDLYPYHMFLGSGKCANLLFNKLSDEQILEFFQSAAGWRLLQKRKSLEYRVDNPSLSFKAGVAMALGYKNNTEAFLQLFLWLYSLKYLGEEALLALACGACGIFEKNSQTKWGNSAYYQHLYAFYLMLSITHPTSANYNLSGHQVRPLNHPVRRLACLAKLLVDESLFSIYQSMINLWDKSWQKPHKWPKLKKDWIALLPTYQDPHWSTHYLFETESKIDLLPMIGKPLKQEILVNVFFPLLYQEILKRSDPLELKFFNEFYNTFSAAYNSKTKYLIHRFFGESTKKEILNKADTEQGAFQLHRDFCLHYEASCEGCPFIENYQKNFKNNS